MSGKINSLNENILERQFIRLISKSSDVYINRILKKNKEFDFDKPVILFGAARV